jgi:release factor glutamine methyltransferase
LAAAASSEVVARLRAAGCVFAEDEARLLASAADSRAELDVLVTRRVDGLPLEHVLGWAEFHGRRIAVEEGVFVPRRRSEFLIDEALARTSPGAIVVDLCCGSGALGAALAAAVGPLELHAVDLDPVAVRCAKRNLAGCGGVAYVGDLYAPLPPTLRGRVDVLLASPPYVPSDAIRLLPPEARDFEPALALDGGADGLDVLRRVVAEAPQWLAPGGRLYVESSEAQAAELVHAALAAGLVPDRTASPDDSNVTVVVAVLPL